MTNPASLFLLDALAGWLPDAFNRCLPEGTKGHLESIAEKTVFMRISRFVKAAVSALAFSTRDSPNQESSFGFTKQGNSGKMYREINMEMGKKL